MSQFLLSKERLEELENQVGLTPEDAQEIFAHIKELEKRLQVIADWKLPPSGRFWDEPRNTKPVSYGAAFGSNGERDYMRRIAREALKQ